MPPKVYGILGPNPLPQAGRYLIDGLSVLVIVGAVGGLVKGNLKAAEKKKRRRQAEAAAAGSDGGAGAAAPESEPARAPLQSRS